MSDLTKHAEEHGIPYESSDSGSWIRFPCPHGGHRYVVRSSLADGYLAWCESEHPERPDWSLHLDELLRAPDTSA
ncbi:MAG TPA: hypothetical protein VFZ25_19775 [Chloroflexota bacterium]|nr:hypothetical protein [Chloroflexota bacterium]